MIWKEGMLTRLKRILLVCALAAPATAAVAGTVTPLATAAGAGTVTPTRAVPLTRVSDDPLIAAPAAQPRSEVEPAAYAHGGTIVTAFQVGRLRGGGSLATGWATRRDGVWRHGLLPGLTRSSIPPGPFDRVSDASVAYDAAHRVWLVASLALVSPLVSHGPVDRAHVSIVVSRSPDGVHWRRFAHPYAVVADAGRAFYDKEWIACDNTVTSPYYGRCYATWDRVARRDHFLMSASRDGGQTWSAPVAPAGGPTGLGGEPVVRGDGTVVVPAVDDAQNAIVSFRSTNGGATWGGVTVVSRIRFHVAAGGLRTEPLPSVAVDGGGRVYVAWQDCRFEPRCAANDILMSVSDDGLTWSPVARVPIDPIGSGVDHFIPGLGGDPTTSGPRARLGLAYYYYPNAACTFLTCALDAGFVFSTDGGATWSASRRIAGPMSLNWIAGTTQGVMVGDYITTVFSGGEAIPIVAVAHPPRGGLLDEAMYAARPRMDGPERGS